MQLPTLLKMTLVLAGEQDEENLHLEEEVELNRIVSHLRKQGKEMLLEEEPTERGVEKVKLL